MPEPRQPHDPFTAAQHVGRLLSERRPQLMAYIERQLGTALRRKVEPEDIYQEVSIEAVRSAASVDLAQGDPFSWLCQIAERRIVDAHRRFFASQKRDGTREASLDAPLAAESSQAALIELLAVSMTTASQAFSRNLREVRLAQAVAALSEEQREAVRLRYVEGLPSKEIAQRLGKSDGAVRVMLTRALARLQELLGPESSV
jgi:RNA polymerase sigma-70 factor (ECF subfamily)